MARVPYCDPDDLPEEYRDLLVSSLQPGKTVNVYRAIGNNPSVLAGMRTYLGALWTDSGLTDRERELVILAVAREFDNEYEWQQHVNIARSIDLPDEDVRAISAGDLGALDATEATLVRYALAVANGEVDDALHEAVSDEYEDETVVGAASIGAAYMALARVLDALDVDLEDAFVGWDLDGE